MNCLVRIKKLFSRGWSAIGIAIISRVGFLFSDRLYLKLLFRLKMGYPLNLNNPKTYSEKLQWLKLYNRKPEYTVMVDKYAVKQYVADRVGAEYVIPTLGVWERVEDIDFDKLPNKFVLKTTHDSGGIVICLDKNTFDIENACQRLNKNLKQNFFKILREWPYKNVPPRIIAEEYIVDNSRNDLPDYKFFCFDGEVKAMFVAVDRSSVVEETKFNFYDMNFNLLPFTNGHPNSRYEIEKPTCFQQMKNLATELSKNIPHVRVDFYEVNGRIFFGEITFFHWSGMQPFVPVEWDYKFGEWIHLPKLNHDAI